MRTVNRYVIVFFVLFNITLLIYYMLHFFYLLQEMDIAYRNVIEEDENSFAKFVKLDRDKPIPAGMHVRINMQTGEREGRWLTKEDFPSSKETSIVIASDDDNPTKSVKNKYQFNTDRNNPNEIRIDDKDREETKRKFRSYEQLKKEMSELNLSVKTDVEVLNQLMQEFHLLHNKNQLNVDDHVKLSNMLTDLESLLHQVDNAEEFAKQNGMFSIILPMLKSNSSDLRKLSARALGAAVQNNAKAQIAALKAGVIPHLLRNIDLDKNLEVRSSSIYGLSCLVRSFPLAEVKLIDEGGLSVLTRLFDERTDDTLKLQLKVVTFFGDLILEKEDAKLTLEEKEKLIQNVTDELPKEEFNQIAEKFRQYNMVELNSKLIEHSWCAKLSHLLADRSFKKGVLNENEIIKLNENDCDHTVVDDVISATLPIIGQCKDQFLSESKIATVLTSLVDYYEKLSLEEKDDTFYRDILKKVNDLCIVLKLK